MRHAILAAMILVAAAGRAPADPVSLQTGAAPVINVVLRSGSVTIRTWNRNAVQVDAGTGVQARHIDPSQVEGRIPEQIPAWSQTVQTKRGPATLEAETFVLPRLRPGPHDGVIVRGNGDATITIPNGTALLIVRLNGRDGIDLQDYRDGGFVLTTRAGKIALRDVSGTGFLQTVRAPIIVRNSSFSRLRVRNAIGTIAFSGCSAEQIEVSSDLGSILYDDGSFSPGLARFESTSGDVAIGVGSGSVRIGAHSTSGRIATAFNNRADVEARGPDTRASIGSNGPAVTASTGSGTILLYDGTFRNHAALARISTALKPFLLRRAKRPPR